MTILRTGSCCSPVAEQQSGPWAHFLYLEFYFSGSRRRGEVRNSEKRIAEMISPTVEALGLELWGIEHMSQGKYSTLRIFIESEEGVTLDDCEKVSRQVSAILDVEDPIAGEYTLEVSSPGLDRPLFTIDQFENYSGSEVSIRLSNGVNGRRKFKGLITEVSGDTVCVDVDGENFALPHSDIERANIVY